MLYALIKFVKVARKSATKDVTPQLAQCVFVSLSVL